MGYYTNYYLTDILDAASHRSVHNKIIPQLSGMARYLRYLHNKQNRTTWTRNKDSPKFDYWYELCDLLIENYCHHKWYDDEQVWADFATRIAPNLIFIIEGQGEEETDFWQAAFHKDKVHIALGTIVYPNFNLNKIRRKTK